MASCFIDENIRPVLESEFEWADAVLVSGMHIQRRQIFDLARRVHQAGKGIALGGPSVSAAPENYENIDALHCGAMEDGTLELFRQINETPVRPKRQIIFRTVDRLPMTDCPTPAYRSIDVRQYLLGYKFSILAVAILPANSVIFPCCTGETRG